MKAGEETEKRYPLTNLVLQISELQITFVLHFSLTKFIIMKKLFFTIALMLTAFVGFSQCKLQSDGKTLSSSSNATLGKISSDGASIYNNNNSFKGKVASDGKSVYNGNNSLVFKIDNGKLMNSNNSQIGSVSDAGRAIGVSSPTTAQVALWWFLCKN